MRVYVVLNDAMGWQPCCHVGQASVSVSERFVIEGSDALPATQSTYTPQPPTLCGRPWDKRDSASQFPQGRLCKQCERLLERQAVTS